MRYHSSSSRELADVGALLRRHGLKMTEQRRLVFEALQHARQPICAPHILDWVQKHKPNVNKSTVYRTVEALTELGLLSAADLGEGRIQYEISTDHLHHHLVCEGCGTVLEVDDQPFQALREQLLSTYGFEPSINHIALQGRCNACTKDETNVG